MKSILKAAFSCLISFNAFATTIEETILMAHKNSDKVAIKEMEIEIAESDVLLSLQKFLPSISYSMQRGNASFKYPSIPNSMFSNYEKSYNLQTDTFYIGEDLTFHKLIADKIKASQSLKSQKAQFRSYINQVTLAAVEKHIDIFIAQESIKLMKAMEVEIGNDLKNASIKNALEAIEPSKYISFESKYDDISSRILQAKMNLEIAIDEYFILTKHKPENLEFLTNFKLPASNFDDYLQIIMSSNSTLESQKATIEAISAAKISAFADIFLPKITIYHQNQKSVYAFLGAGLVKDSRSVLDLSFSIYDRGEKIDTLIKAKIQKRIKDRELLMFEDELKITAKRLWFDHHSFLLLERSKKKDVEIENINLKIAQQKFKNGSISFSEYIKAKAGFYNAKINYLNTYREFVLNYYKILSLY